MVGENKGARWVVRPTVPHLVNVGAVTSPEVVVLHLAPTACNVAPFVRLRAVNKSDVYGRLFPGAPFPRRLREHPRVHALKKRRREMAYQSRKRNRR